MPMNNRLLVPRISYNPNLPATIANLEGWWDASDGSTLFDATSGGSPSAFDSDVARWEDKSGNDRHFTQDIGANRPQRKEGAIGGQPAIYFDGNNDRLTNASNSSFNFFHGATGGCAFVVFVADSSAKTGTFLFSNSASSGSVSGRTGVYLRHDPAATRLVQVVVNGGFFSVARWEGSTGSTLNAVRLQVFAGFFPGQSPNHAVRRNRKNVSMSVIDGITELALSTSADASFGMAFGASSGTAAGWYQGYIGEIIFYSGSVADVDRNAIENYLAAKWGAY